MPGSVSSLQRCPGHREPMVPLKEAVFDEAGLRDDAHRSAGSIRSILLEDQEVLDDLGLEPGQVKENVTLAGVGVNSLPAGTRLSIGEVVLEITKPCGPCERMEELRAGLRGELEGRRGALARVVTPGTARVGDPVDVQIAEVAGA